MKVIAFIVLFSSQLFSSQLWADFAVITHPTTRAQFINKSDLKQIFTGSKTEWDQTRVLPCRLDSDSAVGRLFLQEAIGMSPSEYERYWLEQELSGRDTAPRKFKRSEDVISYVAQNKGALCFVDRRSIKDGTGHFKQLTIN